MPVHVEQMTTEVAAHDGELPLNERQLEAIATRVMHKLQERDREQRVRRAATTIREDSAPEHGSCCGG